jgi:thiazole synthase ThiGH ThiG subunit
MNPSVRDRLGSVVRALNGVVLPALPKEASLAQEQVMLAMGHIQIILAQMDVAPAFEADEANDLVIMADAIAAATTGGPATTQAISVLKACVADASASSPSERTNALQAGIDTVLIALAQDGEPASRAAVTALILKQGAARADKDRRWFAAMGFDIDYSGG